MASMKILFDTDARSSASTIFNAQMLTELNGLNGTALTLFQNDYENHDIVLFMGHDPKIKQARSANKNIKIGIIDPRPGLETSTLGADFLLTNGLEMSDYYRQYCRNIFTYYIIPPLPEVKLVQAERSAEKIVIGYHGNKIHLDGMHQRITRALSKLEQRNNIEIRLVYNKKELGEWTRWTPPSDLSVRHIQWSEESYLEEIASWDIGIAPSLIPIQRKSLVQRMASTLLRKYNEEQDDYLLRFKATSNPGRIFVFAHFGIPVVADMSPSHCQVIQHGTSGYLCHHSDSWLHSLNTLVHSKALRVEMGQALQATYLHMGKIAHQNEKLHSFLKEQLHCKA